MEHVLEDERSANSSFVEMVWRARSERASTFTSVAASNWEMVIATSGGKAMITARGPETKASEADFPADAEFIGIIFKLGTFMPHLPVRTLLDRQDATLPEASSNSFWLHGSAWELPTFENADVFVDRLIRRGILVRDPVVEETIRGHTPGYTHFRHRLRVGLFRSGASDQFAEALHRKNDRANRSGEHGWIVCVFFQGSVLLLLYDCGIDGER